MSTKVNGLKELSVQLDKIVAETGKAEYVRQAGQFVRGAAVEGAPAVDGYLRQNIFEDFETDESIARSEVFTNVQYGPYVELGTGPKGAASHAGISPDVNPVYTMEPWWIHESQVEKSVAERYNWYYIDTEQGRFYRTSGQAAQPFMYPALKNNQEKVLEIIDKGMDAILKENT